MLVMKRQYTFKFLTDWNYRKMENLKLVGPFKQLITMNGLAHKGPIKDNQLEIIEDAGILIHEGFIHAVGAFNKLRKEINIKPNNITQIEDDLVALPGFIDTPPTT